MQSAWCCCDWTVEKRTSLGNSSLAAAVSLSTAEPAPSQLVKHVTSALSQMLRWWKARAVARVPAAKCPLQA